MRAQPVDLIGGYYTDDALSWSCQDTVNWLPVMAEVPGTKTPKKLATPPGLKPYQQIGTGPIRGMHDLEGGRFVVSGRYLFRITPAGVGVPVGVIPGVGRVSMTHNQYETGYQLLVENGQGGGGYVYTSSTDTFAKITDEGYPGSISSDYLDSYLLGVEPQGRYWFHSNLADATDYNTLDRYEAEAAPDRIVGLIVSAQEVVVFSQRTTEFFYNTGQNTGTFQNKKCGFDRGCASRHTIKNLDNSPIWLGDDGVVYRLDGYSAVPISTRPIEKALAGQNWSEAFAHTWEDRGFKIYYLTLPDGRTWGYDVVTRLWTRRESPGLRRWRLMDTIRWGGKWYGGDFQDGRIWELNWDYYLEGNEEFISERTSPCLQDNRSNLIVPFAELEFDVGQGPMTEAVGFPQQPSSPQITNNAPDGEVGSAWPQFTYTVAGGTPPYSFALVSGALPPGIGPLSTAGAIAGGTLGSAGVYPFTVRVTDTNGLWDEVEDSIAVGVAWYAVGSIDVPGVGRYAYGSGGGLNWDNPVRFTGVGAITDYSLCVANAQKLLMIPSSGTEGAISLNAGSTWASTSLGTSQSRNCATVSAGTFLIGCNGGVILRSVDGITFTAFNVPAAGPGSFYDNFNGISTMGLISVAVGDRATISSNNGVSWSSLLSNYVVANGVVMLCIANDGTTFLSAGDSNRMATSANGSGWSEVPSPFTGASPITVAAHTNGLWVIANAAGRIAYGASPAAMTVSAVVAPGGAKSILGRDGRFVIGTGTGAMLTSTNGSTWTTLVEPFTGGVTSITASS